MARVDRVLLSRALTNVVENALHATPGRGTLRVTADADPPDRVRVTVADTGVGMDAAALGRIFEPYFSTKATGTGLGLTIARRNVELNAGTIDGDEHTRCGHDRNAAPAEGLSAPAQGSGGSISGGSDSGSCAGGGDGGRRSARVTPHSMTGETR